MFDRHIFKIKIAFVGMSMLVVLALSGMSYLYIYTNFDEMAAIHARRIYSLASYNFFLKNPGEGRMTAALLSFLSLKGEDGADENLSVSAREAKAVPVLLYHGDGGSSNMPASVFADQMRALKKDGWQTIKMEEFHDFMKEGRSLPEKSFLLTFDDGRAEAFYNADPVLRDLGFSAVMFVITGFSMPEESDKPISDFYLSRRELGIMERSGRWEIESHGNEDHRVYNVPTATSSALSLAVASGLFLTNKFWIPEQNRIETDGEYAERIIGDLSSSKEILEKEFNKKVIAFAYPYSDYGNETKNFPKSKEILAEIVPYIYDFAFYQVSPKNEDIFNYPDLGKWMIKRLSPSSDWSGEDLANILRSSQAIDLPYQSDSFGNEWRRVWGETGTLNNKLFLKAKSSTNGASAILNGTEGWRDYKIEALAESPAGEEVSLIFRHKDDANRAMCVYLKDGIHLVERIGGEQEVLAKTSPEFKFDLSAENSLGVVLYENYAGCMANGKIAVSSSDLHSSLYRGGIGWSVWGREEGKGEAIISSLSAGVSDLADRNKIIASIEEQERAILALVNKKTLAGKKSNNNPPPVRVATVVPKKEASPPSITPAEPPKIPEKAPTPPLWSFDLLLYNDGGSPTSRQFDFKNYLSEWKNIFGYLGEENGALLAGSASTTTSSLAVFWGGSKWQDYEFSSLLDWDKGTSLSLVARYADEKNYLYCSFSNYGAYVNLSYYKYGEQTTIGRSPRLPVSNYFPWLNIKAGIRVKGDEAFCLLNGEEILSGKGNFGRSGSVGFKTFGEKVKGSVLMRVKEAVVNPI